jgi:hypothetical protein
MRKKYRITFSRKYKLWTVWKRTNAWAYPIARGKTLAEAWQMAAADVLHGAAFR